jgi:large subunit ribosomal protein L9
MKVILTDDVVGLGDIGEGVQVRAGYARNYLIPRGLAFESGSASAKVMAHKMRQVESKRSKLKGEAQEHAAKLKGFKVPLELRANEAGRVFGSISARDIALKLTELGHEIDRRRVLLPDAIKKLGEHTVLIKLHPEVEAEIKVVVSARAMTKAEEEAVVGKFKHTVEEAAEERAEENEAEAPAAKE